MIKLSTATRVPVRLLDNTGAGVTGIGTANIDNANGITVIKGDGTVTDLTVVDAGAGQNWFELSTTKAPGLYHLLLPALSTNVIGTIQWILRPQVGGAFEITVGSDRVEDFEAKIDTLQTTATGIKTKTDTLPATPASQVDVTAAIASIKGPQSWDISGIAGNLNFVQATDSLHALSQAIQALGGGASVWDEARNMHIGAGTFGEAIRILIQVARGHIKIDTAENKLKVFQEDGTSLLYACDLKRKGLPASIYADERLQAP